MTLLSSKLCQFGQKLARCQLAVSYRSISSTSTIIDPSFGLRPSERQLQSVATQFALNEFRPFSQEWDEKEFFPRAQVAKAAALGFGGLYVSAESGGSGLSRLETSVILESLAQGCVSTTALLSLHNTCASMLDKFGSEQQKEQFLAKIVSFETMASYCLTEPSSGSDGASLLTTAIKKDGYYLCKLIF